MARNYSQLLDRVPVYDSMPDGWKEIRGAQTAPSGYVWIWNCKSIFSPEYQRALLKVKAYGQDIRPIPPARI